MKLHETDPFLNPEKYITKSIDAGMERLTEWELDRKVYICDSLLNQAGEIISDNETYIRLEKNIEKIGISNKVSRMYASRELVMFALLEPATDKDGIADIHICTFLPEGDLFLGWRAYRRKQQWNISLLTTGVGLQKAYRRHKREYPIEQFADHIIRGTVPLLLFLEFVDIDLKTVSHNNKYKPRSGQPVKNRTGDDIIIADINWSKDIERNTPFAVSGHWRMQRCGPGLSKVKLIWIKPFQKEGYRRKAGKRNLD